MPPPTVIVYDTNTDALLRRVAVVRDIAPDAVVTGTQSRTAVLLLAETAPPGSVALIDLFEADVVTVDRPGEQLVRRIVRNPDLEHVRVVAWSAQAAPDAIRGVRDAGGHGYVLTSLDRGAEVAALARALHGEPVWPDLHPNEDVAAPWSAWFERRFGIPWEPWIEPMLVRLASGRERSAVAGELVALDAAHSEGNAKTRMRDLAAALAGEYGNSPPPVAIRASHALSRIASRRTLAEVPSASASLEHGVRIIATAPSLVRAAGVTEDEVQEIVAFDQLITSQRAKETAKPGAPAGDRAGLERHWAAGQRAKAQSPSRDDIDDVIRGMIRRLDDALAALERAADDDLYFPEARAAAALSLITGDDVARLDGVERGRGGVTWNGLTPQALATARSAELTAVRALAESIDELLLSRRR